MSERARVELPPEPLPVLPDPAYGGAVSPYSASGLRDVVGTRINADAAQQHYARPSLLHSEDAALTCAHPHLSLAVENLEGFDPRLRFAREQVPRAAMTGVIPRLALGGGGKLSFPLQPATYAIDYGKLGARPGLPPPHEWASRVREQLPEGSQLLLTFFGDRSLINGLWAHDGFWQEPFLRQFDGVAALNFSAFSDDPLPQTLQGERMDQIFAEEGSAAGVPVIPVLAWSTEESLRRQVELLASNERVHTVMIDAHGPGMIRTTWAWRWLFAIERYCAPHRHIRWLVAGLHAGWQLRELNRILGPDRYHIFAPMTLMVNATTGSAARELHAAKYAQSIRKIEEFRAGTVEAKPVARPAHWPTYAEARHHA